ncbi:hypothetical protein [Isoptericola aurantiacus]|uniref:hypothetical protein n=1 Tax=Isoptericola aurantiacus TaxID=3377839 RepID=UPI00383A903F
MTSSDGSRWARLFADLEAQLVAAEAAERDGAVAELTRAEQASVPLVDRLRASGGGRRLRVELCDGDAVEGRVAHVATEWFQVEGSGVRGPVQHVVPVAAVVGLVGLGPYATPSTRRTDRLGLGAALRGLQRDRVRVQVCTRAGVTLGRIARVGADHVDVEDVDRARPEVRVVPFAALVRVSSA